MCFRDVVECQDAVAKTEEQEGAEGDEGPEGKLASYTLEHVGEGGAEGGEHTTGTICCWTRGGRGMSSRYRAR